MSVKTKELIKRAIKDLEDTSGSDVGIKHLGCTTLLSIDCPKCQSSVFLKLEGLRELLKAMGADGSEEGNAKATLRTLVMTNGPCAMLI